MQFRYYQTEGLRDIFNGWTTHDILMFILATGGGKTVTFMDVVRQYLLMGKRVMVVAHREELILNAWQTLYDNRIYAGIIQAARKTNYDLRCQVGSIQTLARRKELPDVDLFVFDEGHHAQQDNTYGQLMQRYPNAKVLLVTATPYRLSGDGFTCLCPGKETKLIINKTRHQLQAESYLVPYRYFIADVPDLSNVGKSKGDYKEEDAEKAMLKLAPLVDSYLKHAEGRQGVCFAVNVDHSKKICEQYNKRGIPAAHIDANTPTEERADIFKAYRRKDIMMLVNVGIATEGVDIPQISVVQLGRPTMSLSLIEQMMGRGSRALTGVVDGPEAQKVEQRKARIAASDKPDCIILDNAGALIEHIEVVTGNINWVRYFEGTKGKKVEEQIEITVFVAEDDKGNIVRSNNALEVVGMQLIEITSENQHQIINLKSLKEFDKAYGMFRNMKHINKPGLLALETYIKLCKREKWLINETCWNYIEKILVDNTLDSVMRYEENCIKTAGPDFLNTETFINSVKKLKAKGMSKNQFYHFKREYDNQRG